MQTFTHKQSSTPEGKSADATSHKSSFAGRHSAFALPLGLGSPRVAAEEPEANLDTTASTRFLHSFSQIPVYPKAHANNQANHSISQRSDPYAGVWNDATPMATSGASAEGSAVQPLRGRSESIPYRARMEQAFSADFSTVNSMRGEAAWLTGLGAQAASWPETVAFASTTPSPRVVAHELAHVLQYRNTPRDLNFRRGVAIRTDPAEVEARRAAGQIEAGLSPQLRVSPSAGLMLYTDEEDLDSEEYLQERPPHFTDQEVGSWGHSWPAVLIARERLEISFAEEERSQALVEAILRREPLVIMREYHRLWLYRLEWEGLSARYSRFTNASTIFSQAPEQTGGYAVSNVIGRPEVEAFVTEDGGVLLPPGAGKLFYHTGGEFEDPMVSGFENAVAFTGGLIKGLEDANFAGLAEQLRRMAGLNAVFPAPFAVGALHGIGNEVVNLISWLNPAQWQAVEAAARQTVLILSDPDGEELAAALGEEMGRTQAASLNTLLQKSLIIFAYEVGKLVGPTIVEIVLAFIGIAVGPVAVINKALDLIEEAPRVVGMLRRAKTAFPEIPDRPGFPRHVGEEAIEKIPSTSTVPDNLDVVPTAPAEKALPELSTDEQRLLASTGDRDKYPGAIPKDLADKELAIVRRARKTPIKDTGDGYINEVDIGNGHTWKEKLDGTWCRFSNGGTNCTRLVITLGAQPPGTIVATATRKSLLRDIYFEWAANRANDNVEVALAWHKPTGTYAVVVGEVDGVRLPGTGEGWITIAHSHPGARVQPGVTNPSPRDLWWSIYGTDRSKPWARKWVHSQTLEGEWREVEYGVDLAGQYYIQPTGGEARYFQELENPALEDRGLGRELDELDLEQRIRRLAELNPEEYYTGWWARQFVWD